VKAAITLVTLTRRHPAENVGVCGVGWRRWWWGRGGSMQRLSHRHRVPSLRTDDGWKHRRCVKWRSWMDHKAGKPHRWADGLRRSRRARQREVSGRGDACLVASGRESECRTGVLIAVDTVTPTVLPNRPCTSGNVGLYFKQTRVAWPGGKATLTAGQFVQTDAPAREYVPAAQNAVHGALGVGARQE